MTFRSKSNMVIVVLVVAILATKQAAAQLPTTPNYLLEICRTSAGNYTKNSTYEANLKTVLSKLTEKSSNASFSNASAGGRVFGQYYCRGDINSSLCHDCVKEAAETVLVNCSNIKSAVIWFEVCTLRYDNESMVSVEAERPAIYGWGNTNVTGQLTFGTAANKTILGLISKAAFGNVSPSFFATGEAVVSRKETAFCLVQCSPDLNGTDCDMCLRAAYDFFPGWWADFVVVFFPSCQLRYSTVAFYPLPNAPLPEATAPSPAPSVTVMASPSLPPPPPVNASSPPPPSGDSAMLRSRGILNVGLAISAVVFAFLRFG